MRTTNALRYKTNFNEFCFFHRFDKSKSRNDTDRLNSSNQDESLDYFKKNRTSLVGSTPINSNDEINRLKKELDRCTTTLNTSKYEMESLEKQLQAKIDENKQLKDDENTALVEMAHYKDECQRLNGKLYLLDSELKHGEALEHQKKRLEEYQDQIDELQKMNEDMNDECARLRLYNEELVKEKDIANGKYSDIVQKHESLKNQLSSSDAVLKSERDKLKMSLEDAQKECYELKNKYIEVSEAKDRLVNELDAFRKGLNILSTKTNFNNLVFLFSGGIQPKNLSTTCSKCIDSQTLITKVLPS